MLNSILNLDFINFSFEMTNEIQVYNSNLHNIIVQTGGGGVLCCMLLTRYVEGDKKRIMRLDVIFPIILMIERIWPAAKVLLHALFVLSFKDRGNSAQC